MVTANYFVNPGNITRIKITLVVCSLQFTPLLILHFPGYIPFLPQIVFYMNLFVCNRLIFMTFY